MALVETFNLLGYYKTLTPYDMLSNFPLLVMEQNTIVYNGTPSPPSCLVFIIAG